MKGKDPKSRRSSFTLSFTRLKRSWLMRPTLKKALDPSN